MGYLTINIDPADIANDSALLQDVLDECDIDELIDYCKEHSSEYDSSFTKNKDELASDLINICKELYTNVYTKEDVLNIVNELLEYTTLK